MSQLIGRQSLKRSACLALVLAGVAVTYEVSPQEGHDTAGLKYQLSRVTFELDPEVSNILDSPGPHTDIALNFLEYANALLIGEDALDAMVALDVRLHELEPAGFIGLAGLKEFRRQRNAAFVYDRAVIQAMRFPAPEIIEVDVCTERTDTTGAKRTITIYARNRWVDNMLIERWDRSEELPAGEDCGPPFARPFDQ